MAVICMREENIEKMNFKELRAEVQLLRDELAIFKRKYEDAIYNLDSDNFGKSFTVEQNNMKAQIQISADAIRTKVSKDDFAEYSEISQTAKAISTLISKNVNLSDAVVATALTDMTDTSKLYYIQDAAGKVYYYYNTVSNSWEVLSGNSINSIFEQTANGFKFKGGVQIDGNQVVLGNLTLGGNITWNIQNSPVQSQYSADQTNWHTNYSQGDMYMRMTFDGGNTWGTAVKVVGTDGTDGIDGTDGRDGVVDYSRVNAILQSTYGITSTVLSQASISSPTIYSANIYSPNIYGENLTLVAQNRANNAIYNNLYLTPTSMYLTNAYGSSSATKFYLDLGTDASNSSIKMRLGAGTNSAGAQALNIEKYTDEIRIGTYVNSSGNTLTNFAGMIITPSTGAITFTGMVQAIAVFG